MASAPVRIAPVRPPRSTADSKGRTGPDFLDEVLIYITMPVIGLTVCPGFLLCIPGLVLFLVPLIVLGAVALAAGLVVTAIAAPMVVARAVVHRIARVHGARERAADRRAGSREDADLVSAGGPGAAALR